GRGGSTSFGEFAGDDDPCCDWYFEESKTDKKWLNALPNCPCSIGVPPKNPDPRIWRDPSTEYVEGYHPGAKWCMRSKKVIATKAGQQCCYDGSGSLITEGPGAGTPDRYSPVGPGGFFDHQK